MVDTRVKWSQRNARKTSTRVERPKNSSKGESTRKTDSERRKEFCAKRGEN